MIGKHPRVRRKSQGNMLEEERPIQFLEEDDIEENKTNEQSNNLNEAFEEELFEIASKKGLDGESDEGLSEYSCESEEDILEYDDELFDDPPLIKNAQWEEVKDWDGGEWLCSYNVDSGSKVHNLQSTSSPLEFFRLIFPPSLMKDIMKWTNKRARSTIDNNKRKSQKRKMWFPLQQNEIEGFFGSLIVMGIVRMPSIQCYWSGESKYSKIFSFP